MSRRVVRTVSLLVVVGAVLLAIISMRPKPEPPLSKPIHLSNGAVQGVSTGALTLYQGVPFARPPVGELRWRAPQPPTAWRGTLKADRFKPACMQTASPAPSMDADEISEDCLYLNVWTPARSAAEKLPVMVWLHGGAGRWGSASSRLYWGDRLAQHGVVVVNLSYRLGAFAWLAHPQLTQEASYKASGNYALLDQIAGLQWVQDNIAAFGGDPGNVTLFGQSAGAWYASKLMASPLARGLFHRVIAQSGGDMRPAGIPDGVPSLEQAEQAGVQFARSLGAEMLEQLRAIPAEKILNTPMPSIAGERGFTTIVDGYVTTEGIYETFATGEQMSVPLLVGHNAAEGANLLGEPLSAKDYIAATREHYGDFADRVLAEYPAASEEEAYRSQVRLTAETVNWHLVTWARLHARTGQSKVYFYHFTHVPPWPPFDKIGAAHGAELSYVFGFPPNIVRFTVQAPWKAYRDVLIVRDVQTYWINFAKSGDPNGKGMASWPPFDTAQEQVLELGNQPVIRELPNIKEHALMDAYMTRR